MIRTKCIKEALSNAQCWYCVCGVPKCIWYLCAFHNWVYASCPIKWTILRYKGVRRTLFVNCSDQNVCPPIFACMHNLIKQQIHPIQHAERVLVLFAMLNPRRRVWYISNSLVSPQLVRFNWPFEWLKFRCTKNESKQLKRNQKVIYLESSLS